MRLLKNSAYVFISNALPIVVTIVTVPIYISVIGAEKYGVLVIAWALLGYFGQADFGIGRAITQRISSLRSHSDADLAATVWSGLVSMLTLGAIGGLIVYLCASYFFGGPLKVDPALRSEMIASVWVLALCNPVVAISGVAAGALSGVERFGHVSIAYLISNLGLQLFPLAVGILHGPDLTALLIASLGARVIAMIILGLAVWRIFLFRKPIRPSWAETKLLSSFGAWIMVTALIGPLMVYADRFIIGAVAGAVAVAAYTIPFQVAYRTLILPLSLLHALFPRLAALPDDAALQLCARGTVFIGQFFAPFVIGLICLSAPLLQLWLGPHLDARSVMITPIILIGVWVSAVAGVPFAFIQARGHPSFVAKLHVIELPFYFGLLYVLGVSFGLSGVAAAFSVRCVVESAVLVQRAGISKRQLLIGLAPSVVLLLAALTIAQFVHGWHLALAAAFGLAGASLIPMLWSMKGLPQETKDQIMKLPGIGRIIGRTWIMKSG